MAWQSRFQNKSSQNMLNSSKPDCEHRRAMKQEQNIKTTYQMEMQMHSNICYGTPIQLVCYQDKKWNFVVPVSSYCYLCIDNMQSKASQYCSLFQHHTTCPTMVFAYIFSICLPYVKWSTDLKSGICSVTLSLPIHVSFSACLASDWTNKPSFLLLQHWFTSLTMTF